MPRYRPGRKSRKMYRHYERYGTAGMSRKQLRALAREMDIGVNPRRGRRDHLLKDVHHDALEDALTEVFTNPRSRYYQGRRFTRSAWNPLSCRMSKEMMFHELKHHASRRRPHKQRVAIVLSTLRKCRLKKRRNPVTLDDVLNGRVPKSTYTITSDGERYRVSSKYVSYQDLGSGWYFVARGVPESDVEAVIERNQARVRWAVRDNPKGWARRDHRGFKDGGARRNRKIQKMLERHRDNWRRTGGRRNPVLMNPKRDGSMTRGEKRLAKHADWLREIADRGRKAAMMLKSLKTVPAASHVAAAEHAAEKLSEAAIERAMDGEPKAVAKVEQVVEHAEAKVIRQRLEDLRILVEDLDTQIKEAEAMNDEALAEELMEQKVKVAKQRTALKQKADGLAIQTNPRRRTVLVGTRAYAHALAQLKAAIRRGPRRLRVW